MPIGNFARLYFFYNFSRRSQVAGCRYLTGLETCAPLSETNTMANITVQVPVVVQQLEVDKHLHYHIRPLFFLNPVGMARLYDEAVSRFKREVRERFRAFQMSRNNINELLWYLFNPKITRKIKHFDFKSGKQFIRGDFDIAYFTLRTTTFICLPGFDSFVFAAEETEGVRLTQQEIFRQAMDKIDQLLRLYKKNAGVDTWDMEPHYAKKGSFVSTLEFSIEVNIGRFAFEGMDTDWMFAFFMGMHDFDGQVELEKVGKNLNEDYPQSLKRAFYQEELVEQLTAILYGEENTPIVLVGDEGVGRHSVVEEVVFRYNERISQSDSAQQSVRQNFWKIDPTRIIAGMSIVGMWQKRFESILTHVRSRLKDLKVANGMDKLLIDNTVALLRIGKSAQNTMTLSDVLKPYLEKRQLKIILIATPEEWKIVQEKDRRFADLFQIIRLQEPKMEWAVRMVLEQRKRLELENECTISIPAIRQLFTIQRNYFKRRALPGIVCRLMTQLATKYRYQNIDIHEVQTEFKEYSGMNIQIFDTAYVFEDQEVERNIEAALIGQPQAVRALAQVIHTTKSRLNNPYKPLNSFLFIGPTGVGKTEAAKVLCRYLLGSEEKLLRFDMNEYIDGSAVSRLIGDYYQPEGQLTGRIRYNPFGVVLFDEIEKAHPAVHDLLLQVLDDGRLTDAMGRTVDFSNTIIIMTSNIGAQDVSYQVGFKTEQSDDSAIYRKAVENFFRPEFVNRIDKIVIFNPLQLQHILEIAKLQIQNLLSRDGFVRRTTILNVAPDALDWIARRGFNSKMGGRALKRQIEQDLTTFTAEQLVKTGDEHSIIFNILLEEGVLRPRIEILQFIEPLEDDWMPNLPKEGDLRQAYQQLLRRIQAIQERIGEADDIDLDEDKEEEEEEEDYKDLRAYRRRMYEQYEEEGEDEEDDFYAEEEDDDDDYYDDEDEEDDAYEGRVINTSEGINWQYYQFKNRLIERKEHCQRILMGLRSDYLENMPTQMLRLKNAGSNAVIYRNINRRRDVKKILLEDMLFQQSALEELRYVYINAPEQFDRLGSIFLQDYMEISFLERMAPAFVDNQSDKVYISLHSAIANMGKEEIEYLRGIYEKLLQNLEAHFQFDEAQQVFTAEGYALHDLLKSEEGYHFFYRSHQNPLPIRVLVQKDVYTPAVYSNLSVIRVYDIWLGAEHKSSTLTDLRTGYTNLANITPGEFKLFLLAGA